MRDRRPDLHQRRANDISLELKPKTRWDRQVVRTRNGLSRSPLTQLNQPVRIKMGPGSYDWQEAASFSPDADEWEAASDSRDGFLCCRRSTRIYFCGRAHTGQSEGSQQSRYRALRRRRLSRIDNSIHRGLQDLPGCANSLQPRPSIPQV